jgi:hypothetical protein
MSMPPADPPPPAPDQAADLTATPAGSAPARLRRAAADSGGRTTSVTAEWTTTREVPLECAACGVTFVLSYKYRFVEGLAATVVRCPAPGCARGREYYLPVNAFDVSVAAAGGAVSPPLVT